MPCYTIAICDDVAAELHQISEQTRQWADAHQISIHITTFQSAEHFLFHYADHPEYDILLLDIEMEGISGMELARRIREDNHAIQILFITGFSDYIQEGYDVEALHYLMKPVSQEKLSEVLNRAVARLQKPRNSILCTVEGTTQKLYLDEIVYIEILSHTLTIHGQQDYQLHMTIGEIQKQLGDQFCRCHRSFLVNLEKIRTIRQTDILMDTGVSVPMSRRLAADVNRAFFQYYRKEASL